MALSRTVVWVGMMLAFSACGGGDDDDDDDDSAATGGFGTCDLRSTRGSCIETTASTADIANQKEGCLDASGLWSTEPCPTTTELIGCCEYTFGNKFRECFYEGARNADPVAYCEGMFDDGVWTPAEP